ncbi:MAG: DUF2550 family protein [Actinomycetota bacterium]
MDWVLGAAGLLVVALALVAVLYFARMRSIISRVGSFECALRVGASRSWSNGYALYGKDRVDWFPVASLRLGPRFTWRRDEVEVVSATPRRAEGPGRDVVDVAITVSGRDFELVVLAEAYFALLSWLEGAPPTPASFQ